MDGSPHSSIRAERPLRPRLAQLGVLVAVLLVGIVFVLSPNFQSSDPSSPVPFGGDYIHFFVAGYIFNEGDVSRLYDFEYQKELEHDPRLVPAWNPEGFATFLYPPFVVWFLAPFASLPFKVGVYLWAGLMASCFAASVALWPKELVKLPKYYLGLPAACLFFSPLIDSLSSCQNATLTLLILTAVHHLLKQGWHFWAGVVFGLQAFKPQWTLVIAAVMLLKLQWRFLLGASVTGAALLVLSLVVGVETCIRYVTLSAQLGTWIDRPGFPLESMHSWRGFFRLVGMTDPTAQALFTLAATVVTLAVLGRMFSGPLRTEDRAFDLRYAAMLVATILVSPHLLTYDLTVLFLALALAVPIGFDARLSPAERRRLQLFLAATYAVTAVSREIARSTGVQLSVLLLFVLLLCFSSIERRLRERLRDTNEVTRGANL